MGAESEGGGARMLTNDPPDTLALIRRGRGRRRQVQRQINTKLIVESSLNDKLF